MPWYLEDTTSSFLLRDGLNLTGNVVAAILQRLTGLLLTASFMSTLKLQAFY